MKKLIYVILIAILLVLVGKYVKEKKEESTAQPIVVEEENFNVDIVDPVTGEVIGTSEDNIITTTTYDDYDNTDGMVVDQDDNANGDTPDEFIEENPELTQDYDETIIAE